MTVVIKKAESKVQSVTAKLDGITVTEGTVDGSSSENCHPDDANLFVGDLARSVTEEQLLEAFKAHGDVAQVEIKRDKITQNSLGYGFVQFKTRLEATAAKKALHKHTIGHRQIRIGWAQKNTNLFVGDLDPSITSQRLREIFAAFGEIYPEETFVKHRSYGFVRFKLRTAAEAAKKALDGKTIGNRAIRIGWGDANMLKSCVHIQFQAAEAALTEEDLRAAFEPYGEVSNVSLPRSQGGALKGFGFVHFDDTDDGEEAATTAIKNLNGAQVGGVAVTCNFGKRQSVRQRPGKGMGQPMYAMPVMMPIGPDGSWQPVQYVVNAQGYPVGGRHNAAILPYLNMANMVYGVPPPAPEDAADEAEEGADGKADAK